MQKKYYRAIFLSDLHLGCSDCKSKKLLSFLDSHKSDYLYLVGDIIDIISLKHNFHWTKDYNHILMKLLKKVNKHTKIIFIPGNHDDMFRHFEGVNFGDIEIKLQDVYTTVNGERYLVTHGDEFDALVTFHPLMTWIGGLAYDYLLRINTFMNYFREKLGRPYWSLAVSVKSKLKYAMKYISEYETSLIKFAEMQKLDGVICGHIHHPCIKMIDNKKYMNCGDWVDSCSVLVENLNGEMEILTFRSEN